MDTVRAAEVVLEEAHRGQNWRYGHQMVMICSLLLLYIVKLVEPNAVGVGEGLLTYQISLLR